MKTIIGILLLGVIGFSVWKFIPGEDNPAQVPTNTTQEESATPIMAEDGTLEEGAVEEFVTVTYDGTKFTPASITIKQGESVTFINNSSGGMSVASNDHPTHTLYPEFDQYKTAARGQKSFTFKFDKVGTWGYHNHLKNAVLGTVIVTAE